MEVLGGRVPERGWHQRRCGRAYLRAVGHHAVVHKARVSETYARHFADHGIGDLGLPSLRARLDQWMVANGFQYTRPVDRSVGYYCEQ